MAQGESGSRPRVTPTVNRRRLGTRLRELREAAGRTRDDAAAHLEVTPQTISRFEVGHGGCTPLKVRSLLDCYGMEPRDPERAELEQMARAGRVRGWWSAYARDIDAGYRTFIGFEDAATGVQSYDGLVIPGLLQTEDYARAVIRSGQPLLPIDRVERRVRVRMERQDRLANGLHLWAILDEAVIRRVVGGRYAMATQLERLLEAAQLPNVTIQIVPFDAGAHPGMTGAFTILTFDDDPAVVYVEGVAADQFLEGVAAKPYALHYDSLRAAGLHPDTSIELIENAVKGLR